MRELNIPTAKVFVPLLEPARDKAAYGGRGSGKSHFFAEHLVETALAFPGDAGEGLRAVSAREIQKSLRDSAKFLIESKLTKFGLGDADGFKIFNDVIKTPGDGLIVFNGLQDHTADSIKSFEGFHRFWNEEAQSTSAMSIGLIRPTIRWENKRLGLKSELWWGWNPRKKSDAVDRMFRGPEPRKDTILVKANWKDNPFFPSVLEDERQECLRLTPEQYDHIWEGGYATVLEGAYFAQQLNKVKSEGRITFVAPDPLLRLRAFCDLGGTGAKADAFSMWIVQFVGFQIRVIDYYEAQSQPLATHLAWMKGRGYTPNRCDVWLPHDGTQESGPTNATFHAGFRQAEYATQTIKNQGAGAAMMRVEALRRVFHYIFFNKDTTEAGIEALGWYHEKKHKDTGVGLGPEHDWSSHCADAFGLMAIVYEAPIADNDDDDYDASSISKSATTGY
jgi:phage terminase large subunit